MNGRDASDRGTQSARRALRGAVAAGTLLALLALPLSASADPSTSPGHEPSGTAPSAAESTDPTAAGSASPAGPAGPIDASPAGADATNTASPDTSEPGSDSSSTESGRSAPSGDQADARSGAEAAAGTITLTVAAAGTPVAGHYYQDIGTYAFSGIVGADDATATVAIYQRATSGRDWTRVASAASDAAGAFHASLPVTSYGSFTFAATVGGAPTGPAAVSNEVAIVVENASIVMKKPATSIDALKDPTVTGQVVPARAGVAVIIEVKKSGSYAQVATATTAADGSYSAVITYGHSHLATYDFRSRYVPANRPTRVEASTTYAIKRAAVIHATIASTTSADVAKTYRAGCPVGPSKLKTISLNYYGFDGVMHRGVLIVRESLTTKIVRGFSSALAHRYPIAKMNNPNVYGGDDPTQMAADNTSGFNCRKVVGNPYAQSPHSYGIAVDVNTVQNPYRDSKGKWWPKNGKSYINRSHHKKGMLFKGSYLTKSLRKDKFFWGGNWSPGKDYQHFEYRG